MFAWNADGSFAWGKRTGLFSTVLDMCASKAGGYFTKGHYFSDSGDLIRSASSVDSSFSATYINESGFFTGSYGVLGRLTAAGDFAWDMDVYRKTSSNGHVSTKKLGYYQQVSSTVRWEAFSANVIGDGIFRITLQKFVLEKYTSPAETWVSTNEYKSGVLKLDESGNEVWYIDESEQVYASVSGDGFIMYYTFNDRRRLYETLGNPVQSWPLMKYFGRSSQTEQRGRYLQPFWHSGLYHFISCRLDPVAFSY